MRTGKKARCCYFWRIIFVCMSNCGDQVPVLSVFKLESTKFSFTWLWIEPTSKLRNICYFIEIHYYNLCCSCYRNVTFAGVHSYPCCPFCMVTPSSYHIAYISVFKHSSWSCMVVTGRYTNLLLCIKRTSVLPSSTRHHVFGCPHSSLSGVCDPTASGPSISRHFALILL